jgi:FAD binding domain
MRSVRAANPPAAWLLAARRSAGHLGRTRLASVLTAVAVVCDPHHSSSKEIIDMGAVSVLDVSALSGVVAGRVISPGDFDYDLVRAGFNGMIDRRPVAIVRIASGADAAAAIAFARRHDLPLAIRSGGHSAPGHGCCDDGVVVDCRDL